MKISEKGQLTIPKQIRDQLGLHKDVEVEVLLKDGSLIIRKRVQQQQPVDKVLGILKRPSDTCTYIESLRRK